MTEMTLHSRHTGFEMRTLAVLGLARYLSITEVPHIIFSLPVRRDGDTLLVRRPVSQKAR